MEKDKKYNVPIEHLTFEYVRSCNNKKELEKIVKCLRSGQEGHYPDLTKSAEAQLLLIAPESSIFREAQPLVYKKEIDPKYLKDIENDLQEWEDELKKAESALRSSSSPQTKLPPIRSNVPEPKSADTASAKERMSEASKKTCEKRIKGSDYGSWDKFDVDDAIMKMEIEEERKVEEAKKLKLLMEKKEKEEINKALNISETASAAYSPQEAKILSEIAKNKGNEYFKEGDWAKAYASYTESFNLLPNCIACNNRAMTLIKLGRYDDAIKDCNYVIINDRKNVKALLRRATAYASLSKEEFWRKGLKDLETVIGLEPNNKIAQKDYQALRKKLNLPDTSPKVPLKIEEVPSGGPPLVTFYGPSTSSFRCEQNSLTHQYLAGPRMYWANREVPCRCNRASMKQNPICRPCGEREINEIKEKCQQNRGRVDPSMCAAYVFKQEKLKQQERLKRTDKLKSLPSQEESVAELPCTTINNINESRLSEELSNDNNVPRAIDSEECINTPGGDVLTDINGNNSIPTKIVENGDESVPLVQTEGSHVKEKDVRAENLALEAQMRGDESCRVGNYKKAIAYYTTSMKLSPNITTLLKRADTYEALAMFDEAMSDYNEILEKDPDNYIAILGRIKSAFKMTPRNYKRLIVIVEEAFNKRPDDPELVAYHNLLVKDLVNCAQGKKSMTIDDEFLHKWLELSDLSSPSTIEPSSIANFEDCLAEASCPEKTQKSKKKKKKQKGNAVDKTSQGVNLGSVAESLQSLNLTNGDSNSQSKDKEELPSDFHFYSSWESLKKEDLNFEKRVEILKRVPPGLLAKVIGEKLDAEMLSEILQCLELMLKTESKRVFEYLSALPKLQRFQTIQLLMNADYMQKMNSIISSIEKRGFTISPKIKTNLLLM